MNHKPALILLGEIAALVGAFAFIVWSEGLIYDNRIAIMRFGATPIFGIPFAEWLLTAGLITFIAFELFLTWREVSQ